VITITLNGKPKELSGSHTVATLLDSLNINSMQVAVAVNGEVVRRRDWPEVVITDNDAVEIVRAVGGGAVV